MTAMAPGPLVTPDHQGPRIDIAVWVCFVISGLAVTAKILTKLGRSQKHVRLANLELDDFFLFASLVSPKTQKIETKHTETPDSCNWTEHSSFATGRCRPWRSHHCLESAAAQGL